MIMVYTYCIVHIGIGKIFFYSIKHSSRLTDPRCLCRPISVRAQDLLIAQLSEDRCIRTRMCARSKTFIHILSRVPTHDLQCVGNTKIKSQSDIEKKILKL